MPERLQCARAYAACTLLEGYRLRETAIMIMGTKNPLFTHAGLVFFLPFSHGWRSCQTLVKKQLQASPCEGGFVDVELRSFDSTGD